ncbi:MAG: hypothetical protein J0H57_07850 [Rhodospirillales bacterium]|nr:hypothetical protein [Rhodospirillales bacterium]
MPGDTTTTTGYAAAFSIVQVLKQCGDDLSRENVMRQAANLHDVHVPMLLPGIKLNTSPTDFYPIDSVMLSRVEGEHWSLFGDLISGRA